jgi:hypothetical protein
MLLDVDYIAIIIVVVIGSGSFFPFAKKNREHFIKTRNQKLDLKIYINIMLM